MSGTARPFAAAEDAAAFDPQLAVLAIILVILLVTFFVERTRVDRIEEEARRRSAKVWLYAGAVAVAALASGVVLFASGVLR